MKQSSFEKVASRWLKKASAQEELQWGTSKLVEALEAMDDTITVWTARGHNPSGRAYEGYESLVDTYAEIKTSVKEVSTIAAQLRRTIQDLKKVRIQKVAVQQGFQIDRKTRNGVSDWFAKVGLDGNGSFKKPQDGYRKALDTLEHFGIVLADSVDSYKFTRDEGRITVDLGVPNKKPMMPPIPVDNSMLVLSFHKRSEENFEVLAYLS